MDGDQGFSYEDLLNWWKPSSLSSVLSFDWKNVEDLKSAVTMFLTARLCVKAAGSCLALAGAEYASIRTMLAANPSTPEDVLDFLAGTSEPPVLERVAENPNTRPSTLAWLARHACPEVRAAVCDNLMTPNEAIESLACDQHCDVRYRLAENANISAVILEKLAEDENPFVSSRAGKTLARARAEAPQVVQMPAESERKISPVSNAC